MRDDTLSVIACGSSAASNLPGYLKWMRQEIDLPLRVLLTRSAERFVPRQVVAWHVDEVYGSDDPELNPTEFARRSLALVVLPATAHTLAAAALGLAGTPAQTALLAAERPALFFPSMNGVMWRKPSVRRHVAALRAEGHTVVEPLEAEVFELWQGEVTIGPVLPPPHQAADCIIKWVEEGLSED
ncbi:flavoprotein [Streptomyces sp. NPDC048172]|uniref:flavoprotein n=1 Tax=Streptomyces sp. NPDC048172 TaxID=3365505 RepID=UPI0037146070